MAESEVFLSEYFYNCIAEIRKTVYGRNNRRLIADALECIYKGNGQSGYIDEAKNLKKKENTRIVSISVSEALAQDIRPVAISGNKYRLEDLRPGDHTEIISGAKYSMILSDNGWSIQNISGNKYMARDIISVEDNRKLNIARAND